MINYELQRYILMTHMIQGQLCIYMSKSKSHRALYARRSRNDLRLPWWDWWETQKGENHGGGTIGEIVLSLCRALFRPRVHALREENHWDWIGRKNGTWERNCPSLSSRGRHIIECRSNWWRANLWPDSRIPHSAICCVISSNESLRNQVDWPRYLQIS